MKLLVILVRDNYKESTASYPINKAAKYNRILIFIPIFFVPYFPRRYKSFFFSSFVAF